MRGVLVEFFGTIGLIALAGCGQATRDPALTVSRQILSVLREGGQAAAIDGDLAAIDGRVSRIFSRAADGQWRLATTTPLEIEGARCFTAVGVAEGHVFLRCGEGGVVALAVLSYDGTQAEAVEEGYFVLSEAAPRDQSSRIATSGAQAVIGFFDSARANAGQAAVARRGPAGWSVERLPEPTPAVRGPEYGGVVGMSEGWIAVGEPNYYRDLPARVHLFRQEGAAWVFAQTLELPGAGEVALGGGWLAWAWTDRYPPLCHIDLFTLAGPTWIPSRSIAYDDGTCDGVAFADGFLAVLDNGEQLATPGNIRIYSLEDDSTDEPLVIASSGLTQGPPASTLGASGRDVITATTEDVGDTPTNVIFYHLSDR